MLRCSKCGTEIVRRSHRRGPLEHLLSLILIFPFRCQLCDHRFLALYGRVHRSPHREYRRLPTRLPVAFHSVDPLEDVRGAGTVVDLSINGCGIESDRLLRRGLVLQLQIPPTPSNLPIEVNAAVVRSVNGNKVGLKFLKIRKSDGDHLRQLSGTLAAHAAIMRPFVSSGRHPAL